MVGILNMINKKLYVYDYDKDTAQKLLEDPEANWDKICGYVCRIALIWLRKKEIAWNKNLDELVPDTLLYACEYAHKYVDRKLFTHYTRVKGKNKGADAYVSLQCYAQNLQLRIGQIYHKYCENNPNSKLNSTRLVLTKSELCDADMEKANQLEDVIMRKYGMDLSENEDSAAAESESSIPEYVFICK